MRVKFKIPAGAKTREIKVPPPTWHVIFGTAWARRTAGGILAGPIHLQFVYPALDGHVSITLLFGTTVGAFTARLMEWVYDEGHCDASMRDWDWFQFGLRLATEPEGAAEFEHVKAAVHEVDDVDDEGRAVRGGAATRSAARAGQHAGRDRRGRAPARARVLGRGRRSCLPGPVREAVGMAVADAARVRPRSASTPRGCARSARSVSGGSGGSRARPVTCPSPV